MKECIRMLNSFGNTYCLSFLRNSLWVFWFILTQMRKFLPKRDYCKVVRALNMRNLGLNFFRESSGLNLIILLVRLLYKVRRPRQLQDYAAASKFYTADPHLWYHFLVTSYPKRPDFSQVSVPLALLLYRIPSVSSRLRFFQINILHPILD